MMHNIFEKKSEAILNNEKLLNKFINIELRLNALWYDQLMLFSMTICIIPTILLKKFAPLIFMIILIILIQYFEMIEKRKIKKQK